MVGDFRHGYRVCFLPVGNFVMAELVREDGENGMSVDEDVGTPMEEGIMESLCDVAIRMSGLLADYIRFMGRYIGGDETVGDPVGTFGSPSVSRRLAPDLVYESRRSVFPRRGLVWEDVCHLPRWDVRTVASVVNQNAKMRGQVMERFLRESTRSFQVPKEFECDRAYLADPADAICVEKMNAYLFRGEGRHPMMADDRVRNIVVRETDSRQWKTAFALLVGTGRWGSFQDYTYFREPGAHETDVRMSGRFEDRTRLAVTFDELPQVPMCLAGIIPPRGLAVKSPRVAYYFGATVDTGCKSVKTRYATEYVLEWAQAVAAALTLEHVMYNRVWVCEGRCVEFLRKFVSFKDFVVDAVRHAVAQV